MSKQYYNVEYCNDLRSLFKFMDEANDRNYEIITMTQADTGGYTILYKVVQ